jgi:hypothetical protein
MDNIALTATDRTTASPKDEAGSPKHCRALTTVVLGVIEALLRDKATDGTITVEDAIRVLRYVGSGTAELDSVFTAQEQRCRRSLAGARGDASSRSDPFKRLMVRPFETLLGGEPPVFPRRFLCNYFEVLKAAFGPRFDQYDSFCREVFQRLHVAYGHSLTWEVFYAEPKISQLLIHALRKLLAFLDTPAGQWVWLQAMTQRLGTGEQPTADQAAIVRGILETTLRGLSADGGARSAAGNA